MTCRAPCHQRQVAHFLSLSPTLCIVCFLFPHLCCRWCAGEKEGHAYGTSKPAFASLGEQHLDKKKSALLRCLSTGSSDGPFWKHTKEDAQVRASCCAVQKNFPRIRRNGSCSWQAGSFVVNGCCVCRGLRWRGAAECRANGSDCIKPRCGCHAVFSVACETGFW